MNAHVDRSITYDRTPQATSKTARYSTALLLASTYCNLVVKEPVIIPQILLTTQTCRRGTGRVAFLSLTLQNIESGTSQRTGRHLNGMSSGRTHKSWLAYRSDVPVVSNTVPAFAGTNNQFRAASAFERVEDGWLIRFNHGEFGGALYSFSDEGSTNYRVSDHRIVDLFTVDGTVYAIEGLAHLNESRGLLIAIRKSNGDLRWTAEIASILPSAPYAVVQRKDRSLLIVASSGIVSGDMGQGFSTLVALDELDSFIPTSAALSTDEARLYVGMRQFVGEVNLVEKKLRFLLPSQEFLYTLPTKEEERIRSAK